jgi:hypothetical protein
MYFAFVSLILLSLLFRRPFAGTVATGATYAVEGLAALSSVAILYVGGHWLYSRKNQQQQFKRLRQDYLDSEHGGDLELEDI